MGANTSKNYHHVPLGFYIARPPRPNDEVTKEPPPNGKLMTLTFNDLPSLSNIAMCSYNLIQLTPHIGQLKSMVSIQMCCNQLRSLPREIGYLRNLTILDLTKNGLTCLPDTIGCLEKLVELKLGHNNLSELPTSIGMLNKLTVLVVSNNQIKQLPRELGGLKTLTTFDASNNPIKTLPAEIGQLAFLRRLKLEGCPLLNEDEISKMAFHHAQESRIPLLSMKELAARKVVSSQVQVPLLYLPPRVTHYLRTVHHCSFCQRPYFGTGVIRNRIIEKNDLKIPLEYRLCSPHWMDDTERVGLLFCAPELQPQQSGHRRNLSASRNILNRLGRNSPLTLPNSSVPSLANVLDKTPQLPQLPENLARSSALSLHRRSFIRSRRSLSIHVP